MLSKQRQEQLVQGLNGTARKVWESVPADEALDRRGIAADLKRRGIGIDMAAVDRCLFSLVEVGLAKSVGTLYQRAPVRADAAPLVDAPAAQAVAPITVRPSAPAAPPPPVATLRAATAYEQLADQMRAAADTAAKLSAQLRELADEADNAAVTALDAEMSSADKQELDQLRTWRGTMKQMLG
jgi:hypothetical protein